MKTLGMLLATLSFAIAAHAAFFAPVVINEIGAHEKSNEEWIEIINRSNQPVDLTGWKFFEDDTNHKLTLIQGSAVLATGDIAIIADDAALFQQKYPDVTKTIFDSSWGSLKETGEIVGIKNATGDVMELFTYLPIDGGSLERIDPLIDDYTLANWRVRAEGSSVGQMNDAPETITASEASTPDSTPEAEVPPAHPPAPEPPIVPAPLMPATGEPPSPSQAPSPPQTPAPAAPPAPQTGTGGGSGATYLPAPTLIKNAKTVTTRAIVQTAPPRVAAEPSAQSSTKATTKKTAAPPKKSAPKKSQKKSPAKSAQNKNAPPTNDPPDTQLFITEFMPNPTGQDKGNEWIELQNPGDASVNLLGWSFFIDKKSSMKITRALSIAPKQHLLITNAHAAIVLRNTPAELSLVDPKRRIVDTVRYTDAPDGQSFAKIEIRNAAETNARWQWTATPSPGEPNPTLTTITGTVREITPDTFTIETETQEKITIAFPEESNETSALTLAIRQGTVVRVLAEQQGNGYIAKEVDVVRMAPAGMANIFGASWKEIGLTLGNLLILGAWGVRSFFSRRQRSGIMEQHAESGHRRDLRSNGRPPRVPRRHRNGRLPYPRIPARSPSAPRISARRGGTRPATNAEQDHRHRQRIASKS